MISAVLGALRAAGVATGSDVVVIEPGPALQSILQERDRARGTADDQGQ